MQNQIQIFENHDFGIVRVLEKDGQPWWVLADVCKALGIRNVTDTAKRLDSDEKAEFDSIEVSSNGTKQRRKRVVVSESGLYAVILRSDKPKARAFRRWITTSVLPSIRRHGAYIAPEVLDRMLADRTFADSLVQCLSAERTKSDALAEVVDELLPKALYYDRILQSPNALPISIIAKDYGMSAVAFNRLLHEMRVQYRVGGTWVLYKKHADRGYVISKTYIFDGEETSIHTCWTQRGRQFIYELLKWYGILPHAERLVV